LLGHFTNNNNKNHISRSNNNTCFESNGVRISPVRERASEGPKHFKLARLILPQRADCGLSLRFA
jgi:hypothetical protein